MGERASAIDRAFSIYLHLGPTGDCYRSGGEEPDPHRVLLSLRVVDHVSWVNVTPALELLQREHELLPSFFYHSLHAAMSHWFRVFDIDDARWRWADWIEMRNDEEEESKAECERKGEPNDPAAQLEEPKLPACIQPEIPPLPRPAPSLARSRKAKQLIAAIDALAQIAQVPHPPINRLSEEDREDLFPDADPDVPMLALAFGDHDAVTEVLNEELEIAGQVELEPWPIFKLDGTDPDSIRNAFACAGLALDTLAAASRVLLLIPGFEPMS